MQPFTQTRLGSTEPALCGLTKWLQLRSTKSSTLSRASCISSIPRTSEARQTASLNDRPIELPQLLNSTATNSSSSKTVLYLGYGSNMSAETFRGRRNIKPLSQVNVVVPALSLTFDLPGIPYSEPCFGNVRYRSLPAQEKEQPPHHKDRWPKGLVGIVYEVTEADYIHIIATEGGGSSYQDVLVDCYTLSSNPNDLVPASPSGTPFKAHTLFSPTSVPRPDPSYAQPSPRYLKLVIDGAAEHALPFEYQAFLNQIRTYHITSARQRLGQFIFMSIWAPIFAFLFGGAAVLFLDKDGRYPPWLAKFAMATFAACWGSYDALFKDTFGDGERTMEKGDEEIACHSGEKCGLLRTDRLSYGGIARSDEMVDQR